MNVTRLTAIFQLTTAPPDLTFSQPHTAGWTESFYTTLNPSGYNTPWNLTLNRRARLLPNQASILGFRTQQFTLTGNKLIPGGATSGKYLYPGNPVLTTDLPQVALELSFTGAGVPNTSRPVLRGIPDIIMQGGEYTPFPAFSAALTQYIASLVGTNFGFVGRDLSQQAIKVQSIVGNVLTTQGPIPGWAVNDYIRLFRVTNLVKVPVKGSFTSTVGAGANQYVLHGYTGGDCGASGTVRRDLIAYFNYGAGTFGRALVKKVGRPSQGYRGRRSKSRAA